MTTIDPDEHDWVPRLNAFMLHLAIVLVALLAAVFFATPARAATEQRPLNGPANDGERPFVFTNLKSGAGLDVVVRFVEERGTLRRPAAA